MGHRGKKHRESDLPLRGATILQVIPHLAAGGAERTTIEVAEALVAAGATALVVSAGGRLEKELIRVGGELIRLESAPTKNPLEISANAGRIAKLVTVRKVGLVHARSRAPAWSALRALRAGLGDGPDLRQEFHRDPQRFAADVEGRIAALSRAQARLSDEEWSGADGGEPYFVA